jgi:hypothetical protein
MYFGRMQRVFIQLTQPPPKGFGSAGKCHLIAPKYTPFNQIKSGKHSQHHSQQHNIKLLGLMF